MNFDYAAEKDRKLLIALIFSVGIHILLLYNWPVYRNLFMERMRPGDIEVTYLKSGEKPAARQSEMTVKRPESQPELSPPKKLISEETPRAVPVKEIETEARKKEPAAPPPAQRGGGKKTEEGQNSKIVIKQAAVPKMVTNA